MLVLMARANNWFNFASIDLQSVMGMFGALIFLLWTLLGDRATREQLLRLPNHLALNIMLFRANHELHMRLLALASVLVVLSGSYALMSVIVVGYVQTWMVMLFSMPLIFSVAIAVLVAATPGLVAAPMLIYIKRYPPEKWMSSRIDRLSRESR